MISYSMCGDLARCLRFRVCAKGTYNFQPNVEREDSCWWVPLSIGRLIDHQVEATIHDSLNGQTSITPCITAPGDFDTSAMASFSVAASITVNPAMGRGEDINAIFSV